MFTTLSSGLKGHLMISGKEALFPAGGSMAFPGNSSDGHYVRFNLLAGTLLLPGIISAILDTKVKFQRLPVVSFKQMYWTGTQSKVL
jgi:hypothetical protein